ncbi:unannotated protein [freshwater metagenome]|uniref:Unannotated protein n=1 Tax=freshwater metagenome TaxID=449393 RepID=A0A6J7BWH8_9ZZZZ
MHGHHLAADVDRQVLEPDGGVVGPDHGDGRAVDDALGGGEAGGRVGLVVGLDQDDLLSEDTPSGVGLIDRELGAAKDVLAVRGLAPGEWSLEGNRDHIARGARGAR